MKSLTQCYIIVSLTLSINPDLFAEKSEPVDIAQLKLGDQVELVSENGQNLIRVKSTPDHKPTDILFLELEDPSIEQNSYALTGEVRYENVADRSYLEIWNHFVSDPDGKRVPVKFFARGLNHTGPMGVLSANSDWREFLLPFFVNPDGIKLDGPTKITFNLHLEGRGLVEIRNVKLVDGLDKSRLPSPVPAPKKIMFLIVLYMGGPVILITLFVILRRKNRTAAELRRIRAADA